MRSKDGTIRGRNEAELLFSERIALRLVRTNAQGGTRLGGTWQSSTTDDSNRAVLCSAVDRLCSSKSVKSVCFYRLFRFLGLLGSGFLRGRGSVLVSGDEVEGRLPG